MRSLGSRFPRIALSVEPINMNAINLERSSSCADVIVMLL